MMVIHEKDEIAEERSTLLISQEGFDKYADSISTKSLENNENDDIASQKLNETLVNISENSESNKCKFIKFYAT